MQYIIRYSFFLRRIMSYRLFDPKPDGEGGRFLNNGIDKCGISLLDNGGNGSKHDFMIYMDMRNIMAYE